MYKYLLLALFAPTLAMGWAMEDIYDEAVLALSSDIINSSAYLVPFNYEWTQRIFLFFNEKGHLYCSEGVAGPLGAIQRPPDEDVLPHQGNPGVLSSTVTTPNFRFNYSRCELQLGLSGSEHYSGDFKDNELDLLFSVRNSDAGCLATVYSLRLGLTNGVTYDKDNDGIKLLAKNFGDYIMINKLMERHIEEGLNSHFQKFINRTYTLPHQCPS